MIAREEQKAERNTKKSGKHEPGRAAQVNLLPVLYDNYASDGNRHQHGEWGSHLQRNAEGEQWNRNQGFAKAECRPDQRGDQYDK